MKTFDVSLLDLNFIYKQVVVPIIRVVKYLADGTPVYGYTVPSYSTTQTPGTVVELGVVGVVSTLAQNTINPSSGLAYTTFTLINTSWAQYLPPVVAPTGTTPAGVGDPYGLRNVQGLFNNISLSTAATWGAAFYSFARSSNAIYTNYLPQLSNATRSTVDIYGNSAFQLRTKSPTATFTNADLTTVAAQDKVNQLAGLLPGQNPGDTPGGTVTLWGSMTNAEKALVQDSTYGVLINPTTGKVDDSSRYANPFLTVYDYTPRMISQTVDSQEALVRMDLMTPGTITDVQTYNMIDLRTNTTTAVTESFRRNLNTLAGDPSLTGWSVLFGQFFDHGLDSIGKGANTVNGVSAKVYIPLDPSDPMYDPTHGVTKLSISRATVDNPQAAGPDGMFGTKDDIISPGSDNIYGTADDVIGPTNPNYINHTSPYIDQSQTYGSDDTVTNLLRQWVIDPNTGKYIPGMRLLDGTTLSQTYNRQNPDGTITASKDTLPTLNELRAYLAKTGRDDLSWSDISNLRVRDANGKVLSLAGGNPVLTGDTLIADQLPRLDAAHLLVDPLSGVNGHVDLLAGFDSLHIDRGTDTTSAQGSYISDYINLVTGTPTALGLNPTNSALLSEILLRSIGDHYVAGDGRANENFGLTAIHHVWHENHNWQVDNLMFSIAKQQALDPTHAFAHQWQIATAQGTQDALGNYIDSSGNISWDQEKIFQAALLINQMEYQHVAIDQYARGHSPNIPLFVQYDSAVNSDVSLDYSQVAFRFGHSQLRESIDALDPNGSLIAAVTHYSLESAFLNPNSFATVGPAAIAEGMTRQVANEIDEIVTPALQKKLLGQPQDLAAINIARGRDLGMPTLNKLRTSLSGGIQADLDALRLKIIANPNDVSLRQTIDKTISLQVSLTPYTSWTDFGNNLQNPDSLNNFLAAYSFDGNIDAANVVVKLANGTPFSTLTAAEQNTVQTALGWSAAQTDVQIATAAATFLGSGPGSDQGFQNIDAWNGGLAEKHVYLGELGSTFDAIFADQMTRLINGDRFYYFWRLQLGLPTFTDLSDSVTTEQFKDIIERTTGATHLLGNVMFSADSYIELSQNPTVGAQGQARLHQYGDLLASPTLVDAAGNHLGIYSGAGKTELLNGTTTSVLGVSYIQDARPNNTLLNPDGTPSSGFNSHEVIAGTSFADCIDAGDGDDTIYGGPGNDYLVGGAGADHVYGEGGNDTIYGGTLPDFLDGGDGNDTIYGGDDVDVLIGGAGNDKIFGDAGIDELHGGTGDDSLDGGTEADLLFGNEGQDTIYGNEGLDTMYGASGDDRIFGGAGPDQLFGGHGDDILNGGTGGQNQGFNVDECLGEFGYNAVSFSDVTILLNAVADLNFQNVNLGTSTPFGQLWVNINAIEGSGLGDQIIGDVTGNWLIGGGANDILSGGGGDDVIIADSMRLDLLDGAYDANGVLQKNGILDKYAIAGGKHFVDLLKSVPDFTFGDTVSLSNNGITYTHSTDGINDLVVYKGSRFNFLVKPIFDPKNPTSVIGINLIDVTGQETGATGDLIFGAENIVFGFDMEAAAVANNHLYINPANLPGTPANGVGTYSVASLLAIPVNNGTATLAGFASQDSASPLASSLGITAPANVLSFSVADPDGGVNKIVSQQWQLQPLGSTTWNNIAGATGATFEPGAGLFALGSQFRVVVNYLDGVGNANMATSAASDPMGNQVIGTINNDNLVGTIYQDVIYGGAGNDSLNGLAANDYLAGGLGNDIYTVDSVGDVVVENTNEGTDTVISSITYTLGNNLENLTLSGTANINGTGNTLVNVIIGNSGNNILDGGTGADNLSGGLGDDTYVVDNIGDTVTENANEGTDTVISSITYTLGNNLENLTLSGTANINGTGNTLSNIITGNTGNNTLSDGGGGIDTLIGGLGNDTYVVTNSLDVITENAGEGTDLVRSSVNFVLAANVDNLTLTGTANINGTGNTDANIITGNNGNNVLDDGGVGGSDTLSGGSGADTYIVNNIGDLVVENSDDPSIDLVQASVNFTLTPDTENLTLTGTANINGTGNTLANVIIGNSGDNILNDGGVGGIDTLTGGAGNDTYIVNNIGDRITELANGGTDTVQTSLTYTLGANLENLTLTGIANVNGTGNTLANVITGNTGNNILNDGGVGGSDTLVGGAGNDTYIVNNSSDVITEAVNAGTDVVQSSVSYVLAPNIENITLTGTANTNATGNILNNTITGNTGSNILNGGAGADTLNSGGGRGIDTYQYSQVSDSIWGTNVNHLYDTITGYKVGDRIDATSFNGNRVLRSSVGSIAVTNTNPLTLARIQALLTNTTFAANSIVAFTTSGVGSGTFVAINDATAGFSATNDQLVFLQGYNISTTNTITVI